MVKQQSSNALVAVVANNVKAERLRLGITQEKLAGLTGLSVRFISRFESGAYNIRLDSLEKFSNALGVPARNLLSEFDTHSQVPGVTEQFKAALHTLQSVYQRCFSGSEPELLGTP